MIIETYIIDYLQKKTGVSCYAQYDDASQDTFIVVEKTGGYTDNFIRHATLAIQSYGSSLYDAALLNEKVKEAMDNAAECLRISASRHNSDYNYTDTSTKHYRYQAVYDLVF